MKPDTRGKRRLHTRLGLAVLIAVFSAAASWTPAFGGQRLSVTVSKANVRSGPGIENYDILWEVEQYHPVEVVQEKDGWVLFKDFEGDQGWIHSKLLGTQETVITRKDNCNIRKEPGLESDIAFRAEKGVPFKVLEKKGEWLLIQSIEGDQGWIHKALVW